MTSFQNYTKKGFTLIELLVVIAIIGLLASVVLASFNTARAKAGDAAVKETLANLRNQMALYYHVNGNYGPGPIVNESCDDLQSNEIFLADQKISELIESVKKAAGYPPVTYCNVSSTPSERWIVVIPLRSQVGVNWCVDSSGAAKTTNIMPAVGSYTEVCP